MLTPSNASDHAGDRARRLALVQHTAGYLTAGAMLAYLAVKWVWVVLAAGLGEVPDGWSPAGWVVLNLVTIVMAGTGAGLGLALARDWHRLLRGRLLVAVAWLVAGFLVSLLPFMAVSWLLGLARGGSSTDPAAGQADPALFPGWESALLTFGFVGTAVGVVVGLPVYVWRRWPVAATWRDRRGPSAGLDPGTVLGGALAVILGTWWLAGARRGGWGDHIRDLTVEARVLEGTLGSWAVVAGLLALLAASRPGSPVARLVAGFVGSGSLFAWCAWRLPFDLLRPAGYELGAAAPLAVAQHLAGVAAGLLLLRRLASLTASHRSRPHVRRAAPGGRAPRRASAVRRWLSLEARQRHTAVVEPGGAPAPYVGG